ncbi:MAG TPA: HNH endonuclease signature motif containing protein [Candidatus Limnocylindrales bacterium]|nr:HNH endonuclease signature motif containing protein [Candidatus Limnocylindrales bacterium]
MPSKAGKYYSEDKLRDIRWEKKRIEILERDGGRCQAMDENGKQCWKTLKEEKLQVHHRNYTTANIWDEPSSNLLTLCKEHHKEEQFALGKSAREVSFALMKSNWMVKHRKLLTRCISEKLISPEEFSAFVEEKMKKTKQR